MSRHSDHAHGNPAPLRIRIGLVDQDRRRVAAVNSRVRAKGSAAGEGRAALVGTAKEATIRALRDFAVHGHDRFAIIILSRCCDGDLVRGDAAADVGLEDARVSVGGVAVEEIDFSSFIRRLTGTVQKDKVHDTGHSV